MYAALRGAQVNCVMARGLHNRLLGFQIYSKQLRPFSYEPELFIWAAWDLPIREWLDIDDMTNMVAMMWRYIENIAMTNYGTDHIAMVTKYSRAKAFAKKFGWKPTYVTFQITANRGGK